MDPLMGKISLIPLCNITCESHFSYNSKNPFVLYFIWDLKDVPPYKESIKMFLCKYIKKVGLLHLCTKEIDYPFNILTLFLLP
jgi:hypothetical protein